MVLHGITFSEQRIAEICQARGVRRLSIFGSILRDDFDAESDVDMLVEFEPGRTPGLFGFAGLQLALTELLGRRVHLHTAKMLAPEYRDDVVSQARVQYAA